MLIVSILTLTNNRRVAEIQIMEKKLISSSYRMKQVLNSRKVSLLYFGLGRTLKNCSIILENGETTQCLQKTET